MRSGCEITEKVEITLKSREIFSGREADALTHWARRRAIIALMVNGNSDRFPGAHVTFGVRTFYDDKQFTDTWYPVKKKNSDDLLLRMFSLIPYRGQVVMEATEGMEVTAKMVRTAAVARLREHRGAGAGWVQRDEWNQWKQWNGAVYRDVIPGAGRLGRRFWRFCVGKKPFCTFI
ncbi:hypothetical protein [Puia dinghuensis]|uniref:Uncharacterized protein n=1 Tax=Puia dinghuensis TaxID=1792502 RepID=A0A8J2XS95_9BACT|nr:hypothetical protein [Puia dinghuensis]GGA93713.1 hypothetical protein GCM10011511_16250 [Puia dinghuensis]